MPSLVSDTNNQQLSIVTTINETDTDTDSNTETTPDMDKYSNSNYVYSATPASNQSSTILIATLDRVHLATAKELKLRPNATPKRIPNQVTPAKQTPLSSKLQLTKTLLPNRNRNRNRERNTNMNMNMNTSSGPQIIKPDYYIPETAAATMIVTTMTAKTMTKADENINHVHKIAPEQKGIFVNAHSSIRSKNHNSNKSIQNYLNRHNNHNPTDVAIDVSKIVRCFLKENVLVYNGRLHVLNAEQTFHLDSDDILYNTSFNATFLDLNALTAELKLSNSDECMVDDIESHVITESMYPHMAGEYFTRQIYPLWFVHTYGSAAFTMNSQLWQFFPSKKDLYLFHYLYPAFLTKYPVRHMREMFEFQEKEDNGHGNLDTNRNRDRKCRLIPKLYFCGFKQTQRNQRMLIFSSDLKLMHESYGFQTASRRYSQLLLDMNRYVLATTDKKAMHHHSHSTMDEDILQWKRELIYGAGLGIPQIVNESIAEWKLIGLTQRHLRRTWINIHEVIAECNRRYNPHKYFCFILDIESYSTGHQRILEHKSCHVIIGIHGAQLTDAIWMQSPYYLQYPDRNRKAIIELMPEKGPFWVNRLSSATPIGLLFQNSSFFHCVLRLAKSTQYIGAWHLSAFNVTFANRLQHVLDFVIFEYAIRDKLKVFLRPPRRQRQQTAIQTQTYTNTKTQTQNKTRRILRHDDNHNNGNSAVVANAMQIINDSKVPPIMHEIDIAITAHLWSLPFAIVNYFSFEYRRAFYMPRLRLYTPASSSPVVSAEASLSINRHQQTHSVDDDNDYSTDTTTYLVKHFTSLSDANIAIVNDQGIKGKTTLLSTEDHRRNLTEWSLLYTQKVQNNVTTFASNIKDVDAEMDVMIKDHLIDLWQVSMVGMDAYSIHFCEWAQKKHNIRCQTADSVSAYQWTVHKSHPLATSMDHIPILVFYAQNGHAMETVIRRMIRNRMLTLHACQMHFDGILIYDRDSEYRSLKYLWTHFKSDPLGIKKFLYSFKYAKDFRIHSNIEFVPFAYSDRQLQQALHRLGLIHVSDVDDDDEFVNPSNYSLLMKVSPEYKDHRYDGNADPVMIEQIIQVYRDWEFIP